MLKRLSSLVLGAMLFVSLNACNTMEGVGKDIKKAGEKIEKTAK